MPSTAAMTWSSPVLPPPTTGLAWRTYRAATAAAAATGASHSGSRRRLPSTVRSLGLLSPAPLSRPPPPPPASVAGSPQRYPQNGSLGLNGPPRRRLMRASWAPPRRPRRRRTIGHEPARLAPVALLP